MIGLERVAWSWVLDHMSETGVLPYSTEAHKSGIFKFLLNKGHLSYNADGSFGLSTGGQRVYEYLSHLQNTVQYGRPIANKDLVCDLSIITGGDWRRIQINNMKSTYDGSCLLIGVPRFLLQHARKDLDQLDLDIRVAGILDDVDGGFSVDAVPFAYQRMNLFDPGLVWFQTERGILAIQEIYYDLLFHYLSRWSRDITPSALFQDKGFILIHYTYTKFKLEHAVVAIVAECIPEGWPRLNIEPFQEF